MVMDGFWVGGMYICDSEEADFLGCVFRNPVTRPTSKRIRIKNKFGIIKNRILHGSHTIKCKPERLNLSEKNFSLQPFS